ncbi:hypothetical protein ACIRBX_25310 [Kitasatospora sp. NPDC096147]|uniref:hypothetical protein n=1 Tax=Kitasatospora sp. NPDC096147 TaxID=3364093 RepID=UPI0038156601
MKKLVRRVLGRRRLEPVAVWPPAPSYGGRPGGPPIRRSPPGEPRYRCTVTAYFSAGQPLVQWACGTADIRFAVRALESQLDDLALRLSLDEGSVPVRWRSTRDGYDRATYDLAAGRTHAITFTHDAVTYVLEVAPCKIQGRQLLVGVG